MATKQIYFLCIIFSIIIGNPLLAQKDQYEIALEQPIIHKKILDNGLTVLIRQTPNTPDVAIQLFYHVGSKDEKTNEKGLAHLLEHMVFKGTHELLSEADIPLISHKLSGYCNAHTTQDYTCYEFTLPTRHWQEALPILADCMSNCSFKQDLLNAEFKAVIQELKMYRDTYSRSIAEEMISTIFSDHPYHFPIIGFKQDIWNIQNKDLMKFYKKHYIPNNATLVIIGNINQQEAFNAAEQAFGFIPSKPTYKKHQYYCNKDIKSKSVTLFRDIQNPELFLMFIVPGLRAKMSYPLGALSSILAGSQSARLTMKLIEEQKLAHDVSSFLWQLFDHSAFFIYIQPKDMHDTDTIIKLVEEEINKFIDEGASDLELTKIMSSVKSHHFSLLEKNASQAHHLGKTFLATQDEQHAFSYLNKDKETLQQEMQMLLRHYFRPSCMHKGFLLPLHDQDKSTWQSLQKLYDEEDQKVLDERIRQSEVEAPNYANKIQPKPVTLETLPYPTELKLENGLRVLYYHNPNIPKVTMLLRLQAQAEYEDDSLPGLYTFMMHMILNGTKDHAFKELHDLLEAHAISIHASPGFMSMGTLSTELEFGLTMLTNIITAPTFDEAHIEKVRDQMMTTIREFWDSPIAINNYLFKQELYKDHPWAKNTLGTLDSIAAITKKDLIDCHKKFMTPINACVTLVGDLSCYDVKKLLEKTLGAWKGEKLPPIIYPPVKPVTTHDINYTINRDQVALSIGTVSVDCKHPDYYPLVLADIILSGSMSSKLFALREKTGLFYTIQGTFTMGADHQPGYLQIKTIVSPNNLALTKNLIKKTLNEFANSITDAELEEAKNQLLSNTVYKYATNNALASTFLYLARLNLPWDFYVQQVEKIKNIQLKDVQQAVRQLLTNKEFITIEVGRV